MKTIPLEDDRWRVFMDTEEYCTLLKCAYEPPSRSRKQVQLEMRLMACSLRVDTTSELLLRQFEKREIPNGEYWVVKVEAKDSTDREAETRPRAVFIPQDLMTDIKKYAKRRNIGEDDKLFQCTTRTIQRDVKRSAKHAAIDTGDDDFEKVSPHDLRRYFATHLLFRHEVPSPVVRVLGGWKSDEAMFEYLVLPDDVLFDRLAEAGLLGTSYDKLSQYTPEEKIEATAMRLADQFREADSNLVESAGSRVQDVFESIRGITVDVSREADKDSEPDTKEKTRQISFSQIQNDERGFARPGLATKVAYVLQLTTLAWVLTIGAA